MHSIVEKSNSTSTATVAAAHVKTSKKKSKNHQKSSVEPSSTAQNDDNEDCSTNPDDRKSSSMKENSTVNGTAPTTKIDHNGEANLKAFTDQLDDCLRIRENGCLTDDPPQLVENGEPKATISSTKIVKSKKYKNKSKANCIENGKAMESSENHKETIIENGLEKSHANNGQTDDFQFQSTAIAVAPDSSQATVPSPPLSSHQKLVSSSSSLSPSSTHTEQISNKSECQGLVLGKASDVIVSTVSESAIELEGTAAAAAAAIMPDEAARASSCTEGSSLDSSNIVIEYKEYESELQMQDIMRLIQSELSEPYSIYTYRYFIYNWPKLCFLAAHGNEYVGAIVCKLDMHMNVKRGYIAMLAVKKEYRKMKIGTNLVQKAIEAMLADDADEVVLETEMKNLPALRLYENLGFVRDKRLFRYYLNGVDALRLKLWFR